MKCLMCNKEIGTRKGKEVCSTTCRVDKHKAFKMCDKLLEHFLKDEKMFKHRFNRDTSKNREAYRQEVIEEIISHEGKIGVAWGKKLGTL